MCTHTHARVHTHKHTIAHTNTHSHMHTHAHTLTHAHTHTHSCTQIVMENMLRLWPSGRKILGQIGMGTKAFLSLSLSLSVSHTHMQKYTHTLTHMYTHTHIHTHTQIVMQNMLRLLPSGLKLNSLLLSVAGYSITLFTVNHSVTPQTPKISAVSQELCLQWIQNQYTNVCSEND